MSDFVHKTIGQLVRETAFRYPENPALIYPEFGLRQNYRELYQACRDIAKGLIALDIKKGDKVAVWTTNIPEWLYLQFSLGMVGGVLVTVNTNYQSHELAYILNQSDATTLFLMEAYRDISFYQTTRSILPELDNHEPGNLVAGKFPFLKNVVYIGKREETQGMFPFADVVGMGRNVTDQELDDRTRSLDDHDVINMQYTSGTTGLYCILITS
jgi:fatty-acyl-CoA synthase